MLRRLAGNNLLSNLYSIVGGNSKAHARAGARVALDDGVDAHQLTVAVYQSTTRVARVNSSVGLNHVGIDVRAISRRQSGRAVQRAHDARRDRLLVTKGAADSHNPLAYVEVVGVAHLNRCQVVSRDILKLNNGQVARSIGAHQLSLVALAIHRNRNLIGSRYHVVVGKDIAVGVEHNARANGARGATTAAIGGEDTARAARGNCSDRNHRGQRLSRNCLGQGGVFGVDGDGLLGARRARCGGAHASRIAVYVQGTRHNKRHYQYGTHHQARKSTHKHGEFLGLGLYHGVCHGLSVCRVRIARVKRRRCRYIGSCGCGWQLRGWLLSLWCDRRRLNLHAWTGRRCARILAARLNIVTHECLFLP